MTKEVQLGGRTVKLIATANLPLAYRVLFNRDLLRDMDNCREELRAKTEAAEASQQEAANVEKAALSDNEILASLDIVFLARLSYAMAKSAEPSIPDSMTAWLDTFDDPNTLYLLAGEVLQLYNNGFETTVDAKKNIPPQLAP